MGFERVRPRQWQERSEGSDTALFGDEMQAGLSLRIGGGGMDGGSHSSVKYGSGYFVSALFAERFGTRFWGVGIGHGMHMNGSGEP